MSKSKNARDQLQEQLHSLSGQKRKAADYIVAHAREVTMISLRKVAERARVSPATLVLLARDLGYKSYVELKTSLQEDEAGVLDYFSAGARALQDPKGLTGLHKLTATIAAADARNVTATLSDKGAAIAKAATILHESRRIYVAGMRATYGAAHYLAYLLQLVRDEVVFVDDSAALGVDILCGLDKTDAFVSFGFYPYVRRTVKLTQQAADAGAQIVAITDSARSPLVHKKACVVTFSTETPWVVGSITAAVSAAQAVAAHLVSLGGPAVLGRLREREKVLTDLDVFTS